MSFKKDVEQSRSAVSPSCCTCRGAMIEQWDMRTQPEADLAAARRMSRAEMNERPSRAFATGIELTVVAIAPIVCAPWVETLAPIAPPG